MKLGEQIITGVLASAGAGAFGAVGGYAIHDQLILEPAKNELDCAKELASNTSHDIKNLPEPCSESDLAKYITGPDTSREVWRTDAGGRLSQIYSKTIDYGSTEKIVTEARANLRSVRAEQDDFTVTGGVIGLVALTTCVIWRVNNNRHHRNHLETYQEEVKTPKGPFEGVVYPDSSSE